MPNSPRTTALVVDSDPRVSAMGAAMLGEFGMDVAEVASAEAALDHLCAHAGAVGVVVADIRLSGPMNGVELAHRVAVLWPTVSIIVVAHDDEDQLAVLPRTATFLRQPWHALDLVSATERATRADHSVHAVQF